MTYSHSLPDHRTLPNRIRLGHAGKATVAICSTGEIYFQHQKLRHDPPQKVIDDQTDSVPRHVLVSIVTRGGFTTY